MLVSGAQVVFFVCLFCFFVREPFAQCLGVEIWKVFCVFVVGVTHLED